MNGEPLTLTTEQARAYAKRWVYGRSFAAVVSGTALSTAERESLFAWVRARMAEVHEPDKWRGIITPDLRREFERAALCEHVSAVMGEMFATVGGMNASWVRALCEAAGWPE